MPRSAAQSNLTLGVVALLALTVWRVVALAFDTTDLWVDEAQYWLWGQRLDWGYFSKPPMIAWLSRAVTDLAGSDAIFWIRAPGAVLHLITAGVLGLLAARLSDRRTGLWAAAIYLTAPFATLGSWQFSTDTVLLPFYATALLAFVTLTDRRSLGWALILGAAAGGGLLSKYALIYLPITAAIAALLVPRLRIAPRDAAVAGIIALAVVSPNLIWNAMNGAQTLRHTASDNAQLGAGSLEVGRGLTFFVEQFGVFGPATFGVFLVAAVAGLFRGPPLWRGLALLAVPTILFMVVQAIRAQAHANWAVTAYAAGSVLVALALVNRPKLRWIAVGLNGIIAVLFPLLFINGDSLRLPDGRYLAARYLGPAALSQEAAAVASANGVGILVSDERGIMADLFHTLRDTDLSFRAVPPDGAPKSFYQASFPLAADAGRVLLITRRQTECAERPIATIEPEAGIYRGRSYGLYLTDAACVTR